ncbi:nitroreductase family protein [Pedobacter sp. ISL-68]|uniref:nitroreductase family protein n=1 Tax=unclassified Pedobacter TaxID=2628915 RepID=UPI001BE5E23D|nr:MULTISPECIES: nitroreductase family protein [unclassified Pedobacter]MBT2560228.1 nitroreductase family protein [Pedobacter sp. ISL-64]MBT2589208.1 nitroreductase family protein [Pedobacter sp. ISL-68]
MEKQIETKIIEGFPYIPYSKPFVDHEEMLIKCQEFLGWMDKRRTIRDFSDQWVPKTVIEQLILTASTAPSGAHKQPWVFCAVSDPIVKKQIRQAAEKEEFENYQSRMPEKWLEALRPFGTDWHKPFLETAPWLIIAFKKSYDIGADKEKINNYYVNESVGLACGFLMAAIHNAGLATLPHTPSPMNFLSKVLQRPENEKAFLLLPIGYPASDCFVPDLKRKSLDEVSVFYDQPHLDSTPQL